VKFLARCAWAGTDSKVGRRRGKCIKNVYMPEGENDKSLDSIPAPP